MRGRASSFTSNDVPFAPDTLPECLDTDSNDEPSQAPFVSLPIIVSGQHGLPGRLNVFKRTGMPVKPSLPKCTRGGSVPHSIPSSRTPVRDVLRKHGPIPFSSPTRERLGAREWEGRAGQGNENTIRVHSPFVVFPASRFLHLRIPLPPHSPAGKY